MWTFLSFILITVTLKLASVLGTKMGLNIGSEEVALIPFRWLFNRSELKIYTTTFFVSEDREY